MLSQSRLKELLHYDKETGIFAWKVKRKCFNAGDVAGRLNHDGYVVIWIDRDYYAHRLAWLYEYGQIPACGLDHKNRKKNENWIENLRPANKSENAQNMKISKNNKSGFKGVSWHKQRSKWNAKIVVNYKGISLGLFDRLEDAVIAYSAAAAKFHTHNQEASCIR